MQQQITVDLDFDSPGDLTEKIIAELSRQILVREEGRDDEGFGISAEIKRRREELIDEAIKPMVDELLEKPIQLTNGYGEPKGEPVTLTEVVMERITAHLNQKTRYGSEKTNLDEMIDKMIGYGLKGELQKLVDQAKGQIRAAVKEKAAQVIAETVTEWKGK